MLSAVGDVTDCGELHNIKIVLLRGRSIDAPSLMEVPSSAQHNHLTNESGVRLSRDVRWLEHNTLNIAACNIAQMSVEENEKQCTMKNSFFDRSGVW